MKIENRYNVSFKKLIVEDSVKEALIPFVKKTESDAISDAETMLGNFRKQIAGFAKRLSKDRNTHGVDIVFTEIGSDSSQYKPVPTLVLRKGEKSVSSYLHLYDFEAKSTIKIDKNRVSSIEKKVTEEADDWFEKSLQTLDKEAQNAKTNKSFNSAAIIKRIFG